MIRGPARIGGIPRGAVWLGLGLVLLAAQASADWLPDPDASIHIGSQNLLTVGAFWRTEARDPNLISKVALDPGLCAGDDCIALTAGNTAPNDRFLAAPGAASSYLDDGNQNYDQGDLAALVAKLDTRWRIDWRPYTVVLGGYLFYDPINAGFDEVHFNQITAPGPGPGRRVRTSRPSETKSDIGRALQILDAYATRTVKLYGLPIELSVGRQLLPWGEATIQVQGSVNVANPPDASNLARPGLRFFEIYRRVGMAVARTIPAPGWQVEAFYQFEWRPYGLPPRGAFVSFFDAGNQPTKDEHIPGLFGKSPDDPNQFQVPADPIARQVTATSFALRRAENREPNDLGQFGLAVFSPWPDFLPLDGELGFYFANYHSRIPSASFFAAQASCARREGNARGADTTNAAEFLIDCGIPGVDRPGVDFEPLPVDSARYFLDYPENIRLFGMSFTTTTFVNTIIGGEIAFRPNQPVQVALFDVGFAALQPVFPRHTIDFGAATLADSRRALPDFVTAYRGGTPGETRPGQYVRGYERLETIYATLTGLRVLGRNSWLGWNEAALLFELSSAWVPGLPDLDRLQFEGPGTLTHASPGILESGDALKLHPFQTRHGYVTEFSWGYRAGILANYLSTGIRGVSLRPVVIFTHDVDGVAPGLAENFLDDRMITVADLQARWRRWVLDVGHFWIFGGGIRNTLRDRDLFSVAIGYEF